MQQRKQGNKRLRNLLIVVAVLAVIGAIIGGTQSGKNTAAALSQAAPAAFLQMVCSGAETGITMTPVRGVTVPGAGGIYFVAMEFSANGIDSQVGVWATNNRETNGLTTAVDPTAQQFTVWPDADKTEWHLTMSTAGAQEAKDALGAQ